MYIPEAFRKEDIAALHEIMREYSFATLITPQRDSQLPQVSHIPFVVDTTRGSYGTLQAHLARANPQWQDFSEDQEVMVIFQGPHNYITPSWYEANEANVPTWNYAVVHAYGKPRIVEDHDAVYRMLQTLTQQNEASFEKPWTFQASPEALALRFKGLVAFEIELTRLEGKFKLSQNRRTSDRLRVIDALQTCEEARNIEVATLMKKTM